MKYVSDLKELNGKQFDTVAELEAAEEKVNTAIAEKKQAAMTRKSDAEEVKTIILSRIDAEKVANETKLEAYRKYVDAVKQASADYEAAVKAANDLVADRRDEERDALDKFCEKYKDGFHETITKDDVSMRYDYYSNGNFGNHIRSTATSLLDSILDFFN